MQDNIALETAQFSLEGWMTIDKGDVTGGDVWLKQGGASWLGEKQTHTLSVDNLTAHITRENPGWQILSPQYTDHDGRQTLAERSIDAGLDSGTGRWRQRQ